MTSARPKQGAGLIAVLAAGLILLAAVLALWLGVSSGVRLRAELGGWVQDLFRRSAPPPPVPDHHRRVKGGDREMKERAKAA